MKKMHIDNRIYTVCTMTEYTDTPDLYNPKFTAIENKAAGVVLPIRTRLHGPDDPCVTYQAGAMVAYVTKPQNPEEYSTDKIIDYSDAKNVAEIIEKNKLIKDIQQEIMATPDNIFVLNIGDNDTPEMKALKTAINQKCVDKRQYEDRFSQYQNDMRLLKGSKITLNKLVDICSAFDISAELTLRDKDPSVPNPIGTSYSVDLTEREGNIE